AVVAAGPDDAAFLGRFADGEQGVCDAARGDASALAALLLLVLLGIALLVRAVLLGGIVFLVLAFLLGRPVIREVRGAGTVGQIGTDGLEAGAALLGHEEHLRPGVIGPRIMRRQQDRRGPVPAVASHRPDAPLAAASAALHLRLVLPGIAF